MNRTLLWKSISRSVLYHSLYQKYNKEIPGMMEGQVHPSLSISQENDFLYEQAQLMTRIVLVIM